MLSGIGLSRRQEKLYLRILAEPGLALEELSADRPERGRGEECRDLERLLDLGLIVRISHYPDRYAAVAPDAAVRRLVNERIDGARLAEREIDGLMTAFWQGRRAPDGQVGADLAGLVEVISGAEAVAARREQLRGSVRRSIRALGEPVPPDGPGPAGRSGDPRPGGGIVVRVIYPTGQLESPGCYQAITERIAAGEQARVHPAVPARLTLFDTFAAGLDVSVDAGHPKLLIVHRSHLLDCLSALFETCWTAAIPVSAGADDGAPPAVPDLNASIGRLLSSGMTDEAIGHALGISPSTVYRHIHEVMAELGASSRFQAGFKLAQRQITAGGDGAPVIPRPRSAPDGPATPRGPAGNPAAHRAAHRPAARAHLPT